MKPAPVLMSFETNLDSIIENILDEGFSIRTRVKIVYPKFGGNDFKKYFDGKTGEVIAVEKDGPTKMYRVLLDDPVMVDGQRVTSDLWSADFLKRIKK